MSKPTKAKAKAAVPSPDEVVDWLRRRGTKATRDGMARYAIPSDRAFGVPVGALRDYAKSRPKSHELAEALWATGWYEARMLACFVDEPAKVTAEQMDRWRRDFDNWAICDHACFHLFDRTPHAFGKVAAWAKLKDEFGKRAAFALLASLALHDKSAPDEAFAKCLPLVEKAATDDRNFVKKGVLWALRSVVRRKGTKAAAKALALRLAASESAAARWIGKGAAKEI